MGRSKKPQENSTGKAVHGISSMPVTVFDVRFSVSIVSVSLATWCEWRTESRLVAKDSRRSDSRSGRVRDALFFFHFYVGLRSFECAMARRITDAFHIITRLPFRWNALVRGVITVSITYPCDCRQKWEQKRQKKSIFYIQYSIVQCIRKVFRLCDGRVLLYGHNYSLSI